jgi:outer membrane protein assembly factor BamA
LDIIYDSRKNSINPEGGSAYANVEFLQNSTLLGSDSNWNSILIDLRKYFKVAHQSVLAFWFYSVLTISGNPPYLDLPGTGSDTYNNTGRGYEQGRFIGKRYIDLESEFRFPITRNGLLGGVIFCNAESVSELSNSQFEVVYPAFGAGLRIKFNKFSNSNACLDYGVGTKGSRGFFGNLGEVF